MYSLYKCLARHHSCLVIAHKVQCLQKKEKFDLPVLNPPSPLIRKHLRHSGDIDFKFVFTGMLFISCDISNRLNFLLCKVISHVVEGGVPGRVLHCCDRRISLESHVVMASVFYPGGTHVVEWLVSTSHFCVVSFSWWILMSQVMLKLAWWELWLLWFQENQQFFKEIMIQF